MGELGVW